MQTITPEETRLRKQEIKDKITKGDVFIHPTDTIYGLGCDAANSEAVKKIRDIKQRPSTPFSIIAPSIEWIRKNCEITEEAEEWLKKLPGPYTLILKTKNKAIAPEVAPEKDSVGVRIPEHWISSFVEWLGFPIITTSVNVTNEPFMTKIDDLELGINSDIRHKLSFVLYEGEKAGKPSKIIHLEGEDIKVRER